MNRLFSDKNPTSSCGRPKCFRQGRLMLTAKLICFVMIGLVGLNYNAMAQEVPVFIGSSPPVADSSGTLVINNDPQYDDTFQWESSDSILGEIATESVTATRWNYLPGSPARLVFVGNGDGATFYGNVLFEPYNRAVVDVVKEGKRVRYLLKVAELNLEVQHVPDEIEEGSLDDPFTGGLIFINNDRDDPENETQYPDYGSDTADFQNFTDASEDDDLIYVKVNVHGIPGVTVQIQVQVVQGEDKIQLWEAVDGVTPSSLLEYTGDSKTVTVSEESDELLLIMEGKNASDSFNDVRLVGTFSVSENEDPISQDTVTMTVNDIRNVNRQGEEVGEYTTPIPSEVLEPFSHEPGKPGGPGGFGGPPEGSGMTFLMDPYRIVDFVHTVNPDGPDTVTLTLVSNVTEDWTKEYELVEKDPNQYGNDEDFLALEILEEDPTDVMTIEKKVIEIASTEFGIIREMELFETEAASDTFRSRRLELVVTMDALPDPSVEDILEATVTSSLLPGEEHNEELTETGPDTYEFQSEDGTLKIVFIRFGDDEEWRGAYDVDYFTAKVTSDLLDIDEEPVDAIETAESSLEFRTDALHNTNGGEVSTGAYIAIGQKIVWFSEVEKAKTPPGTKAIKASLWYRPQGGSFKVLGGSNGIAGLWDSKFQFNLQTKRLVYPLLILEAKDNNRDAIFGDNVVKCYLIPGDELWVNLEPAKKGWGCIRRTTLKVDFKEFAPCSGFDPTLDPPWLMVQLPVGGNNKAKAEITPSASAGNVDFESAAVTKATVAPATASTSPETVTVTSVAKGDTEVRAKVGTGTGATMGVSVKNKLTKTIVIHAITENNDDVQSIPVGKGKPNTLGIAAGVNGTVDSTPAGDDQVAGNTITTGADGICNTTAAGDDVQSIAVGKGKANETCVTAGTNAKRDTKKSGDDTVVGENIRTGPDGICNTPANATNLVPVNVPTAANLQTYLNDTIWGKQANVFFTVTKTGHILNFDLDRDGMLDDPYATPSGGQKSPQEWDEVNVVRGVKDTTKDFNIYYVSSYEYPIGLTVGDEVFTQGSSPGTNSVENHTAHEVGHLLGRSGESNDPKDVMYKFGLPANPCRVLKLDWDAVNP